MIKKMFTGIIVLSLAASTWILLLPESSPSIKQSESRLSKALLLGAVVDNEQKVSPRAVRVVYPDPGDQPRNEHGSRAVADASVGAISSPPVPTSAGTPAMMQKQSAEAVAPATRSTATQAVAAFPTTSSQTLDINSASTEAMDHLSGAGRIGVAIARNRPYRSVADLLNKRVVRKSVYEKIRLQLAAQ